MRRDRRDRGRRDNRGGGGDDFKRRWRKIYVGRISRRADVKDLEEEFKKFGPMVNFDCRSDYAFIEYSYYKDAQEACYEMDGKYFQDSRLIVEPSGKKRRRGPDR